MEREFLIYISKVSHWDIFREILTTVRFLKIPSVVHSLYGYNLKIVVRFKLRTNTNWKRNDFKPHISQMDIF